MLRAATVCSEPPVARSYPSNPSSTQPKSCWVSELAIAVGDEAVHRNAHRVEQHGFELVAPEPGTKVAMRFTKPAFAHCQRVPQVEPSTGARPGRRGAVKRTYLPQRGRPADQGTGSAVSLPRSYLPCRSGVQEAGQLADECVGLPRVPEVTRADGHRPAGGEESDRASRTASRRCRRRPARAWVSLAVGPASPRLAAATGRLDWCTRGCRHRIATARRPAPRLPAVPPVATGRAGPACRRPPAPVG